MWEDIPANLFQLVGFCTGEFEVYHEQASPSAKNAFWKLRGAENDSMNTAPASVITEPFICLHRDSYRSSLLGANLKNEYQKTWCFFSLFTSCIKLQPPGLISGAASSCVSSFLCNMTHEHQCRCCFWAAEVSQSWPQLSVVHPRLRLVNESQDRHEEYLWIDLWSHFPAA